MSSHPYNLRTRLSSPSVVKPSTVTPNARAASRSPRKLPRPPVALELEHVIGTTTRHPTGLSSCLATNSFAHCAGSVAVLTQLAADGSTSRRFFRARPTVQPANGPSFFHDTPTSTPATKGALSRASERGHGLSVPRGAYYHEDESTKTWSARERIKTVTSVSLSPNGKFLAVGETGYHPRVLLFSTAAEAGAENPLSIMTEHTWGVRAVAFSSNSRYLATLGEANDGYLFVWSIHTKTGATKLLASNKCIANICHMTWCGERLITVGTRHVKIWQLPDDKGTSDKRSRARDSAVLPSLDGPVPLVGRNCLLGDKANRTFTCAVSIDERYALIGTDAQELLAVDVDEVPTELIPARQDVHLAGAMAYRRSTQRLVWAGGGRRELVDIDVSEIVSTPHSASHTSTGEDMTSGIEARYSSVSMLGQPPGMNCTQPRGIVAMECLPDHTVTIDADANLAIHSMSPIVDYTDAKPPASHGESVQGVQRLPHVAGLGSFFTWSKSGEVRFWDDGGVLLDVRHVELDDISQTESPSNEMTVLRFSRRGCFVCGDRFGVLRIIDHGDWQCTLTARAHGAEVNDICLDRANSLVATCSRDRMVQVFLLSERSLKLIQTLEDHIAAINQLLFSADGEVLLSCSADRTIVVRQKVTKGHGPEALIAFLQTRIITVKAAPLSMCFLADHSSVIYVSTLDRYVAKIDYTTGSTLESFKVASAESEDTAVLNRINICTQHDLSGARSCLLGYSSTDKSIRIYDLDKHVLLTRESAHTEGITDLTLLEDVNDCATPSQRRFVSTGLDGTIMVWSMVASTTVVEKLTIEQSGVLSDIDAELTAGKPSPAALPPLRRILNKLDFAEYVRSPSPRSTSRETSPTRANLVRKSSRLALSTASIEETGKSSAYDLRGGASEDDRTSMQLQSPSPPLSATRRLKQRVSRPDISKDYLQTQAEQSSKPYEPVNPNRSVVPKIEEQANKARLRRPPSIPLNLRVKAVESEQRTVSSLTTNEGCDASIDHVRRSLRSYRKRLEESAEETVPHELEQELQALLDTIRGRKVAKKANTSTPRRNGTPVRLKLMNTPLPPNNGYVLRPRSSVALLGSQNDTPNHSLQTVDNLSVLLERANLG